MTDPAEFRAASRKGWGAAAEGWEKWAPTTRDAFMPVTSWMLDAAGLQPGRRVLELACGTGEVGLLAHERIQPGGSLLLSDFAPEMLSAAQRHAEQRGIADARFKQIDLAEPLDLEAGSQDVVLCRWGLMFVTDPESALREIRRVLAADGTLSAATWAGAAENPWSSVVERTLVALGHVEPAEGPGQFTLDDPDALAELLYSAGFTEVRVEPIAFTLDETFDQWWERTSGMSRAGQTIAALSEEQRTEVVAALLDALTSYEDADEVLHIPATAIGIAASA